MKREQQGRSLFGTGMMIAAVVVLAACGQFNLSSKQFSEADIKTGQHSLEVGELTAATIEIGTPVESIRLTTLDANSDSLIEANTEYLTTVNLSSSDQTVRLVEDNVDGSYTGRTLYWDVALNPDVPIDLKINTGIGAVTGDLSGLNLTDLEVNSGVTDGTLTLPVTQERYRVHGGSGTGSFTFVVPDGALVDFEINGGAGGLTVDVPEGAAVRVEATVGVGGVTLPEGLERVSGETSVTGDEGMWETPGFANAENGIRIQYNGGVGSLTVK